MHTQAQSCIRGRVCCFPSTRPCVHASAREGERVRVDFCASCENARLRPCTAGVGTVNNAKRGTQDKASGRSSPF
eukprot:1175772-Pleurochrysis_carterae.AAC.1